MNHGKGVKNKLHILIYLNILIFLYVKNTSPHAILGGK
jgi:hypothetical protein